MRKRRQKESDGFREVPSRRSTYFLSTFQTESWMDSLADIEDEDTEKAATGHLQNMDPQLLEAERERLPARQKEREASGEAERAHIGEDHEQSWIALSLHRSTPPNPGSGSRIREDGWAKGRAETVTLGSHVIRSMPTGKRPLDRHPGPFLLSLFSLFSPGCPSSSIWITESAFVFSSCVPLFCFPVFLVMYDTLFIHCLLSKFFTLHDLLSMFLILCVCLQLSFSAPSSTL